MVRVAQLSFHAAGGPLRSPAAVHSFSRLTLPRAVRSVSARLRMRPTRSFDWPIDRAPIEDPAPGARAVHRQRLSGAPKQFFPTAKFQFCVQPRLLRAEAAKRFQERFWLRRGWRILNRVPLPKQLLLSRDQQFALCVRAKRLRGLRCFRRKRSPVEKHIPRRAWPSPDQVLAFCTRGPVPVRKK